MPPVIEGDRVASIERITNTLNKFYLKLLSSNTEITGLMHEELKEVKVKMVYLAQDAQAELNIADAQLKTARQEVLQIEATIKKQTEELQTTINTIQTFIASLSGSLLVDEE